MAENHQNFPKDPKPDYQGGGIVNLMSSIIRGRGGESDLASLRLLDSEGIGFATNLVLLVIDGLGDDWLMRHAPDGILARHRLGAITSVFPATTASAITTFLTGEPPSRHGLTGWHTWMGELGCVMKVLPGTPRFGGVGYSKSGIDPVRLFAHRTVFQRAPVDATVVTPARIARSDFNLAHSAGARVVGYDDSLRDLFRQTAKAVRRDRDPKLIYAYWPELDAIGHDQGMESPAAVNHLRAMEEGLDGFLQRIARTNTEILVTADHGHVDSGPADIIDLDDHPALASTLTLPLCGEPRAAFAYVRAGHETRFLDYCRGPLGGLLDVYPSSALRDTGIFGPGSFHPRLDERIGDYCLLPRDHRVIRQWLPFEERHRLIGQHGGLSRAELLVPLSAFRT